MTLDAHEFMRRFLLHVLPRGFHRIRHYGLLASATRKASIARARELLAVSPPAELAEPMEPPDPLPPCPCCGGRMRIIETFGRWMPAACAAASVHANRDGAVVTRHGLTASYAAARSLRPATRRAPVVHDRAINDQPPCQRSLRTANLSRYLAIQIKPGRIKSATQPLSSARINLKSP